MSLEINLELDHAIDFLHQWTWVLVWHRIICRFIHLPVVQVSPAVSTRIYLWSGADRPTLLMLDSRSCFPREACTRTTSGAMATFDKQPNKKHKRARLSNIVAELSNAKVGCEDAVTPRLLDAFFKHIPNFLRPKCANTGSGNALYEKLHMRLNDFSNETDFWPDKPRATYKGGARQGQPLSQQTSTAWTHRELCSALWCEFATTLGDHLRTSADSIRTTAAQSKKLSAESFNATLEYLACELEQQEIDQQACSIEEAVDHIATLCACCFGVEISHSLAKDILSPLCAVVDPSPFLAKTIALSGIMKELVGPNLASCLKPYVVGKQWNAEHTVQMDIRIPSLLQELVETRQELTRLKHTAKIHAQSGRPLGLDVIGSCLVPTTAQTSTAREHRDESKTKMVEFMVRHKVANKHMPKTLAEAETLIQDLRTGSHMESDNVIEKLCTYSSLREHVLWLEQALDLWLAARIAAVRDSDRYCGYTFASDESPPNSGKFVGLRFQTVDRSIREYRCSILCSHIC